MSISNKVKQLLKNDFNKNFVTLFSGAAIAQIIPLVASVILARLYAPADFGILAIFTSIVMVFSTVVNLRYEFAIPLAQDDKEAVVITLLAGLIAIVFSIILFVTTLIFQSHILTLLGSKELGNWIFLVPLAVFLSGIYNCLNYFSLRFKKYRNIAISNVVRSSSGAGLQLILGAIDFKYSGLIMGYVIAFLFGNVRMAKILWMYKSLIKRVTRLDLKLSAVRFKKFPLVSIWGVLLNNLSLNLNNFVVPRLFGVQQLGFYSYSVKNLNIPLTLIGSNLGQVYYQQCIETKEKGGDLSVLFLSVAKKILFLVGPVFIILFFVIEDIYSFVYGDVWRIAGTYCKVLLPLFLIRSLFSPLSLLTVALERQGLMTGFQLMIFVTNIIAVLLSISLSMSILNFLTLYSITSSFIYLILLIKLYLIAKRQFD